MSFDNFVNQMLRSYWMLNNDWTSRKTKSLHDKVIWDLLNNFDSSKIKNKDITIINKNLWLFDKTQPEEHNMKEQLEIELQQAESKLAKLKWEIGLNIDWQISWKKQILTGLIYTRNWLNDELKILSTQLQNILREINKSEPESLQSKKRKELIEESMRITDKISNRKKLWLNQSEIKKLIERRNNISIELDELEKSWVTWLNKSKKILEDQRESMTGKINSLKSDISSLNSQIQEAQRILWQLEKAKIEITLLENQIDELKIKISKLN